jgi:hypothetical protein
MQENEEPHAELKSALFRDALMAAISLNGRIGREQLLDMVFRAYDKAIAELVRSGRVIVEKSPLDESHLDIFVATEPR